MTGLSVLIPSRNEMFLKNTVEDILQHAEGDIEIIVVLDGAPATEPLPSDPRLMVIKHETSIGQRAATNEAAKIARFEYVMKCDAHCAFDHGFDIKLLAPYLNGELDSNVTTAPVMRNLHAFDWVCPEGHIRYQGPSGECVVCHKPTTRMLRWIAKTNPSSKSYCFDSEPHFQYFREFSKRPEGKGELTESMSLQGSCFLVKRERYFDLDLCDETLGTWGSQGIEVACKSWLSGGRVVINQRTWYAHLFRTQGGDFGFPYSLSGQQVDHAKNGAREMFLEGKWPKLTRSLSWLLDKFWPVPGWTEEARNLQRERDEKRFPATPKSNILGVVYYTDNKLDAYVLRACQNQLRKAVGDKPIVSVSLTPIGFGNNLVLASERGILTMFRQILIGLETIDADWVCLCEHDILYHPSHFDFKLARDDVYYYNTNNWKVDLATGRALYYLCHQTLALCASRQLLLQHYRARVARVEAEGGFNRSIGFEPGDHQLPRGIDKYSSESWRSDFPNIDIRHGGNLSKTRWSQDQFRNKKFCQEWQEADEVPGWGRTLGQTDRLLAQAGG